MGSKSKSSPPAPQPVDPVAQANANVQAQLAALPQAAKLQFDILQNPQYGIEAQTRLAQQARSSVFSEEDAIRQQLLQNVMAQLQSPTGLSPDQQGAVDSRRGLAVEEAQRALRQRAELGGGLFGGRAQLAEQRGINELQNQFAEEDIARQERNRLNNQAVAMSIIQALFPDVGLQQPQFINPVASADTQFSGAINQSSAALDSQLRQYEADRALRGSLYNALGTAAGGFLGGK